MQLEQRKAEEEKLSKDHGDRFPVHPDTRNSYSLALGISYNYFFVVALGINLFNIKCLLLWYVYVCV